MDLKDLIKERRSAIVATWFDAVVETYNEEARGTLRKQNAPLTNPVGFNTAQGLEGLFDGIVKGMLPAESAHFLDGIVRIRAVTACGAPSFSSTATALLIAASGFRSSWASIARNSSLRRSRSSISR